MADASESDLWRMTQSFRNDTRRCQFFWKIPVVKSNKHEDHVTSFPLVFHLQQNGQSVRFESD